MRYTVQPGETANDIAQRYTIGGRAYGQALYNYNGISDADWYTGLTIEIPDQWLISFAPPNNNNTTLGIGIGALIAILALAIIR